MASKTTGAKPKDGKAKAPEVKAKAQAKPMEDSTEKTITKRKAKKNHQEEKKREKKERKIIHPESREARRISRKSFRQTKKNIMKQKTSILFKPQYDKVEWFCDNIPEDADFMPLEDATLLVLKFIHRFDDEIAQLVEENKKRPKSTTRLYIIEELRKKELQLFAEGGYEAPDVTNPAGISELRDWNGDMKKIIHIPMRIFKPLDSVPASTEIAPVFGLDIVIPSSSSSSVAEVLPSSSSSADAPSSDVSMQQ